MDSPNYRLVNVTRTVRIHVKLLTTPTEYAIETMLENTRVVYAQAEIDVEWASTELLDLPLLDDVEVGECTYQAPTTAEQNELFSHRNNVNSNEVVVYFVRSTDVPTNGCAIHPPNQAGAIVTQGAGEWTLAHEVGHVLGLRHVLDRDRLMFKSTRSITNPPPNLIASEISTMFASSLTLPI